jgi:hypothetical protein
MALFAAMTVFVALGITVKTSAQNTQPNPIPLINQPLVPTTVAPGASEFKLTVNGTGFIPTSVVNWNGTPLATTFLSRSQLEAVIPASDVAGAGTAWVNVKSPGLGGGNSNVEFLFVTNPVSSLSFKRSDLAAGNGPLRLVTADFNGDGILDVAAADEIGNTVAILLGRGDGTFQPPVTYPGGGEPFAIAVGDFDADGNLDLAVTSLCSDPNCTLSTVSILLGNGDGTFKSQVQYKTGKGTVAVSVGDFNRDGKLDLAVTATNDSAVSILIGNGDGTFQPYVEYQTGAAPVGVTTGDFNGDGVLDLALTTCCLSDQGPVSILLGNGDGSFQPPIFYTTAVGYLNAIETADLNGDGKLDLIATGIGYGSESGGVSVLLGNGDGTFQTHVDYPLNTAVDSVAVGDFNGDGIPDLAATHINPSGQVSILLGNGDGTFGTALNFPTGYDPAGILAADFNGDGRLDIVTGNRDTTISVLLQSPVDNLPPTTTAISSPSPNSYGWNNTNVTVTLNATDNPGGSGVKQIQFSLSRAENTSLQTVAGNTASVTISAEGITVLTYFATDNAGNQETAKMLTVRIDQTPPVITGLPAPGCTIWPPNHKLVQVATVTATDALSGLAPGSFQFNGTSNDPANGQIVITGGPSQFLVQLGADKGLIYALIAMASDLAGNTVTLKATCTVPHDQGQ